MTLAQIFIAVWLSTGITLAIWRHVKEDGNLKTNFWLAVELVIVAACLQHEGFFNVR